MWGFSTVYIAVKKPQIECRALRRRSPHYIARRPTPLRAGSSRSAAARSAAAAPLRTRRRRGSRAGSPARGCASTAAKRLVSSICSFTICAAAAPAIIETTVLQLVESFHSPLARSYMKRFILQADGA